MSKTDAEQKIEDERIEKEMSGIDFEVEENEEGNDSEKNNAAEDLTAKKEEEIGNETPEEKAAREAEGEAASSKYRPSTEKTVKVEGDTVPLSKYLDVKNKLKEIREANGDSGLNQQTLDEFAEEAGLKPEVAKKYAELIVAQATTKAIEAAEAKVKPIVMEKVSRENLDAFTEDFNKSIAEKYPELAGKVEVFKKIAFSKDFLHLKSLEAIKNEFFPTVQPASKEAAKKDEIEGGSAGGAKETEHIDFATLTDNPEAYKKVMDNADLKKKYFSWQDSQG